MRIKNNVDLVKNLMEISPFGALSQIFIIEAISKEAKRIIKDGDKIIAEEEARAASGGGRSLVNVEAWVGTAKNIQDRMDEFYETQNKRNYEYDEEEEEV